MERHEIVSVVEQQMLRAARGKGPGGGRAQRWPESSTVPGAVSLELLSALCTQGQIEHACRQARMPAVFFAAWTAAVERQPDRFDRGGGASVGRADAAGAHGARKGLHRGRSG